MKTKSVMKNLIIVLVITGLSLLKANAQPPHRQGPPPIPDSVQVVKMVDKFAAELALNSKQKQEILVMHLNHFKEVGLIMEKNKAEHEKNREQMEKLREEFKSKVKEKLSDDQMVKYDSIVKTRPDRMEKSKHTSP